ncbi:hypothetical protein Ciccas_007653 [Cichlidogyrus casuarinus]|uniref:G-protein coupled receptors family 1 profile domain-containing protein n=1 Tax=Cichlidogyrus casuarinus TaxID=1844966 RepID=A0ABD2Q2Y1_9PLAT
MLEKFVDFYRKYDLTALLTTVLPLSINLSILLFFSRTFTKSLFSRQLFLIAMMDFSNSLFTSMIELIYLVSTINSDWIPVLAKLGIVFTFSLCLMVCHLWKVTTVIFMNLTKITNTANFSHVAIMSIPLAVVLFFVVVILIQETFELCTCMQIGFFFIFYLLSLSFLTLLISLKMPKPDISVKETQNIQIIITLNLIVLAVYSSIMLVSVVFPFYLL